MDVHPHRGVDDLLLGSTQDQIAAALGAPDREAEDAHEDGELSSVWTYRMLRLELSFDSDNDFRLSHITSYHPYTLVRGFNPMGLSGKLLLMKYPHLDLDVEISRDEKYYTDRVSISPSASRAKVVSVTVFPEYDESGEVVKWPMAGHL
ncbi:MAG: hypothetical protein IPG43_19360 [Proteobacteria bacterium]|nr:hypothetical protein [Pseudomonadota bacterium]